MCKGAKVIRRPHAHPQNTVKEDVCPVCNGTGDVEEIKTDKQQIVLYKYHGTYASQ